jgi:hypothetical protein
LGRQAFGAGRQEPNADHVSYTVEGSNFLSHVRLIGRQRFLIGTDQKIA